MFKKCYFLLSYCRTVGEKDNPRDYYSWIRHDVKIKNKRGLVQPPYVIAAGRCPQVSRLVKSGC